jgi:hypothetical protein
MGGQTFYQSIVIDDPEKLRQSLLKNQEHFTSSKKFLDKSEYSNIKQNSRLMHHYYSNEANAPVELRKDIRLMKKDGTDMKKL